MTKRIIAVLLVFCLCVGFAPAVVAGEPTLESSVNLDLLVEHGVAVIRAMESSGRYDTVKNYAFTENNVTYQHVGMGIMGWIGSSALQLLKWCASSEKGGNPDYCKSVLGEDLYNEVVNAPVAIASTLMPNWSYWKYREFTEEELAAAKKLISSEVGIAAQNALAKSYVLAQAQHGWNAGVRTEAALLYYCSAENHYGEGGVKNFMKSVRNALGLKEGDLILSLEQFHQGAVAAKVSTLSYRTKVYYYLTQTLHLPSGPDSGTPFKDMPAPNHWAYDAIVWAYTGEPQITGGTGDGTTFSPDATLTRAEAMTFLWAAMGHPTSLSGNNPFKDVKGKDWYHTSVLWAAENGLTGGTGDGTTFSPDATISRAEMLTFLWAFAGHPTSGKNQNPFSDVTKSKYYYKAVIWAYNDGILVGNEGTETQLNPTAPCTRAYAVTYLYNYFRSFIG